MGLSLIRYLILNKKCPTLWLFKNYKYVNLLSAQNRNSWIYKTNDGSSFTNSIVGEEGGIFIMTNSTVAHSTKVKKEGNTFFTDSCEAGNLQQIGRAHV